MVLKIRLARFGRRHAPTYNIVVTQARYVALGAGDVLSGILQDTGLRETASRLRFLVRLHLYMQHLWGRIWDTKGHP